MKSWVKLYVEVNRDPKLLTLTWQQRGIWMALLALAGEMDDRDADDNETGILDTVEYTALRIRCDMEDFRAALVAFEDRGMIVEEDGVLSLPNYANRQRRAPSAKRGAVAQRVQAYRGRNEAVTSAKRDVTPSESESESDREEESEPDLSKGPGPSSISTSEPDTDPEPSSDHETTSPELETLIADVSLQFGDDAHVQSNLTRAFHLWSRTPRTFGSEAMMARVREAVRVTRGRAVNGGRMPYFFAVLEDRLGLRESPGPGIQDTS